MPSIAEIYRDEGLLPYSELPDITQPGWCPEPLVIEREVAAGQHLLALGLAHHADVGNPHYQALTESTDRFISATTPERRCMLHEGGHRSPSKTLKSAYEEGCEPQWIQTRGSQTKTKVVSPELYRDGVPFLLEEGFTPPEIACYLFTRQAPQYSRLDPKKQLSYKYYLDETMRDHGIKTGLNYDFQVSTLITLYEDTFHRKFDIKDTQFMLQQSVGYMLEPTTRIQEVAIACNMGRDVNFLKAIQTCVDHGVSVEWVCGLTHVLALKERLEDMKPRLGQLALSPEDYVYQL
jgi:hypothetical protein